METAQTKEGLPAITTTPWQHRHVLDLDDFSRAEIELVLETAVAMKDVLGREVKRVPTLRGKTVVTLFYEPSTRTRVSFELAARSLSADVTTVNIATSSVTKGESLLDTLRTIQSLGADFVVIRHSQAGSPYFAARQLDISVINAGDGWHAHPSQSLLDLYTIRDRLGRLEGIKVVIVGDILHSRVARSNIWGLTTAGAKVVLCGPHTLLPPDFSKAYAGLVAVERNLDLALDSADVVMTLRLQKERQHSGLLPSLREYVRLYQINQERLARAKPGALVLHPGPMNEGIEISPEVAHSPQSLVEEQVTNGVAVRMALLYLLSGVKGAKS